MWIRGDGKVCDFAIFGVIFASRIDFGPRIVSSNMNRDFRFAGMSVSVQSLAKWAFPPLNTSRFYAKAQCQDTSALTSPILASRLM